MNRNRVLLAPAAEHPPGHLGGGEIGPGRGVLDPRALLDDAATLAARYGGGPLIAETPRRTPVLFLPVIEAVGSIDGQPPGCGAQ